MKLVLAIVQDRDGPPLLSALSGRGFGATKLASTGGFLHEGNTMVLVGLPANRVEELLQVIGATCHARTQFIPSLPASNPAGLVYLSYPVEVTVGGATVFILNVERFIQRPPRGWDQR